jgi:hypothetical protein
MNRGIIVLKNVIFFWIMAHNYGPYIVRKNIIIREANVRGRLAWARGKIYWTVERDWSRVIFSDESKIIVGENNRVS